jgi:ferredoxin
MVPAGPQNKKMCVVSPLLETQQRNVYLIGDLLSQVYLETDDFEGPPESFRQVKHRGNIKSSLRDGVFVAEVIRQRLDGRAQVHVVIREAPPSAPPADALTVARLGLDPVTAEAAAGPAVGDRPIDQTAVLVSITPTGIDAEHYALRTTGATSIGRAACDISFEHDTALTDTHASVSHRNGTYFLRDDGSRSGTYLRLRPDLPLLVSSGGLLRVGRQILVVGYEGRGFYLDQYDAKGRHIRRHALTATPTVFGRRGGPTQPDVSLDDEDLTLSRFHLSATIHGDAILIQDFGSRNGTYFKIDAEHPLDHNDIFRVGGQFLQIRLREDLPEKTGSFPVPVGASPPEPVPAPPLTRSMAQPHITFADQGIRGAVDPSETILEWADARNVALDNECWIGMCGCDAIRVIEGAQFLNEVTDKESKTLTRKGLEPGPFRLACMARCSGPVVVEVAAR